MTEEIDTTAWAPYLNAFTKMQRSIAAGEPIDAKLHRRCMLAFLDQSPDYWRGCALRARRSQAGRPRTRDAARWYKQGVQMRKR